MAAEVLAIGRQVDAHQDDFFIAGGGQLGQLQLQIHQRFGADRPPGIGDDAVGAVALAPVLNFDGSPGLFKELSGLHVLKGFPFLVGGDVDHPAAGCQALPDGGQQGGPVVGTGDDVRLSKSLCRVGEGLGETAGQRHLSGGVLPL